MTCKWSLTRTFKWVPMGLQIRQMSNLEVNKTPEAQFQGTKATLKEFWGTLRNSEELWGTLRSSEELWGTLRSSEELPELSNSSSQFIQKSKWITCLFLYFKMIFDSVVIEDISFYERAHLYSTLVFQNMSFQNMVYHSSWFFWPQPKCQWTFSLLLCTHIPI